MLPEPPTISIAQTWKVSVGQIILRRDEADEVRLHRAGQPHDGAAEDEGLEAVEKRRSCRAQRRRLVLADGAQHASPGAARPAARAPQIDDQRRPAPTSSKIGEIEEQRRSSARPANGRGMKPMPKGPPVSLSALSATSWMVTATPNVVMAR